MDQKAVHPLGNSGDVLETLIRDVEKRNPEAEVLLGYFFLFIVEKAGNSSNFLLNRYIKCGLLFRYAVGDRDSRVQRV